MSSIFKSCPIRVLLILIGTGLATMSGCNLISSLNYGEDLGELRREWEVYYRVNESSVSQESLPDLVKAAMNDLDPPNATAAPKICMLSQYGDFLAYRVRFENEVEYHFDVEGNQIEKPMQYASHGGVI